MRGPESHHNQDPLSRNLENLEPLMRKSRKREASVQQTNIEVKTVYRETSNTLEPFLGKSREGEPSVQKAMQIKTLVEKPREPSNPLLET